MEELGELKEGETMFMIYEKRLYFQYNEKRTITNNNRKGKELHAHSLKIRSDKLRINMFELLLLKY